MARDDAYLLDETVWKNHLAAVEELVKAEIAVGVVGADNSHIAKIAKWNHDGTRVNGEEHIPARPFFDITENRVGERKRQAEDMALDRILKGGAVKPNLALVGAWLAGEVQKTIAELKEPANAQSTIDQKGHDKPLIGGRKAGKDRKGNSRAARTGGRLRQSITYEVRGI